jgi:hypothetical protein
LLFIKLKVFFLQAAAGAGEDIKPVHEAEDKGPVKPAKNTSGCAIS